MIKKFFLVYVLSLWAFSFVNAQKDSIDVIHYDISMNVDNQIANGHIGKTAIKFVLKSKDFSNVEFSLKDQLIDSVYINVNNNHQRLNIPSYTYNDSVLAVLLDNNTNIGDTIILDVYYSGSQSIEHPYAWGGLHYDNDIIYSMGVAFMEYPHSYARSWFVVNETFDDKATYDLHIATKKNKQVACSGKFIGMDSLQSCNIYNYKVEQNVAPYLISFAVANFHTYSDTIHSDTYGYDIPLEVKYVYSEDSANIAHNFNNISKAFNCLEKHFGNFRFNRLGYVVTPKGSMEHVDNIALARSCITDTSINAVSNIVHELAHSWFGNLITCKTAEDMWLNEGWATYTTYLTLDSIYGFEIMNDYWISKQEKVLKIIPLTEGWFKVSSADSTMTYSSTVYDKGAMIVLTLQSIMGDSFFTAVKSMLDSFAYKNITSLQLKDYLSQYYTNTDYDFDSIFDFLVFTANNYDIAFANNGGNLSFQYNAYPLQSIAPKVAVNYSIPNINSATNQYDKYFIDINNMFIASCTKRLIHIDTAKLYNIRNTYCKIKVENISQNFDMQVLLHWTGPKQDSLPYGVKRISSSHYWTIVSNRHEGNEDISQLQFYVELSSLRSSFDSSLVAGYQDRDSLILLYRKDYLSPWTSIPYEIFNNNKGYLKTSFVLDGDYCFAVGDKSLVCFSSMEKNRNVNIYPNPSDSFVKIEIENYKNTKLFAVSLDGKRKVIVPLTGKVTNYDFSNIGSCVLFFQTTKTSFSKTLIIK